MSLKIGIVGIQSDMIPVAQALN